jgi:hypothetical protein
MSDLPEEALSPEEEANRVQLETSQLRRWFQSEFTYRLNVTRERDAALLELDTIRAALQSWVMQGPGPLCLSAAQRMYVLALIKKCGERKNADT